MASCSVEQKASDFFYLERSLQVVMKICSTGLEDVSSTLADALKVVATYKCEDLCNMWDYCMEALP